ncbi:MAG: hypothetical protein WC162_04540 [Sphaerochaetaceae bacterium]
MAKKWIFRILFPVILTAILFPIFYFSKVEINEKIFSALYTVIGIFFTVALSEIIGFSFTNIENESFVIKVRLKLKNIRNSFIVLFIIATVFFIIPIKTILIELDFMSFKLSVFIFIIIYFVINYIELDELKNNIEDNVRKEKKI